MTTLELIEQLKKLPQEAQVWCGWESGLRSEAETAYLSKSGRVVICEEHEIRFFDEQEQPIDY